MGRTITREDAKNRSALDFLEEIMQGEMPLIVTLENGKTVSIQEYQPTANLKEGSLVLKPLAKLEGYTPGGWKDFVYGEDGTGTP